MYSNRHLLNASSTARDIYTRKKKNGRSEKAVVCTRAKKWFLRGGGTKKNSIVGGWSS